MKHSAVKCTPGTDSVLVYIFYFVAKLDSGYDKAPLIKKEEIFHALFSNKETDWLT